MDYQGVAILIGALTAFVSVVGGVAINVATFVRQGQVKDAVTQLHDSVNGQSKELKDAIAKVAFVAGEKAGAESERANPLTAAPATQ